MLRCPICHSQGPFQPARFMGVWRVPVGILLLFVGILPGVIFFVATAIWQADRIECMHCRLTFHRLEGLVVST